MEICSYLFTHTHAHTSTRTHAYAQIRTQTYVHIKLHTAMYASHTYVHIDIYTHIHLYTFIHTQMQPYKSVQTYNTHVHTQQHASDDRKVLTSLQHMYTPPHPAPSYTCTHTRTDALPRATRKRKRYFASRARNCILSLPIVTWRMCLCTF